MSQNPRTDPTIQSLFGAGEAETFHSPAPVSEWPIQAWCRAMGDENPVYQDRESARRYGHEDIFAPPVMMHSFTMPGFSTKPREDGLLFSLRTGLSKHGFDSVLAATYEQEFIAPVRLGDRLQRRSRLESMSEEKNTSVGTGHFVVMADEISNQTGELVGRQKLRTLFFRPGTAGEARESAGTRKTPESAAAPQPSPAPRSSVELPPLGIPVTTTLIIAAALATNDFERVHHDRDLARSQGLKDIVMNVLTSCALATRYITDWRGPATVIRRVSTQLKAPTYPGDTLTLRGWIDEPLEPGRAAQVRLRGTNCLGTHIDSIVTIS
ncbi:MAG TPA: MaoC family dehydratase N-terminal domain-containing protein [Steroidobacteraceae bacterium]|nr:MaoC family dehydratase N-terminal domain-containing protein [Steroidobacteraceae bacterium]